MGIIKDTNFENIYLHSAFAKELIKAAKGYGDLFDFQKWLRTKLSALDDPNFNESMYPKTYELLKHLPYPIYSLRFRHGQKNIRILYIKGENRKIYFLSCAFDEKRPSDYDNAIKLALKRKDEWEGFIYE